MRRRTLFSLAIAAALLLTLGALLWLRFHAPPEVARLLPESDAVVYANLQPVRQATHFDRSPLTASPDYAKFIDATGIRFDRDLDRVAFALHRMPDPTGPNGPVAYTEVMEGRFDRQRLQRYLESVSSNSAVYNSRTIYTLPIEGRTCRVVLLGADLVAASNTPEPEQIHSVIDRYGAGAAPFAGSSLLSLRYREVPALALAWGIGHIGLPFSERGRISVHGIGLPLAEDTDFVASVTYNGQVHVRLEEIAPSAQDAADSAGNLSAILNLTKGLTPLPVTDQQRTVREALDSIKVEQRASRVVMLANVPPRLFAQSASKLQGSGDQR